MLLFYAKHGIIKFLGNFVKQLPAEKYKIYINEASRKVECREYNTLAKIEVRLTTIVGGSEGEKNHEGT